MHFLGMAMKSQSNKRLEPHNALCDHLMYALSQSRLEYTVLVGNFVSFFIVLSNLSELLS